MSIAIDPSPASQHELNRARQIPTPPPPERSPLASRRFVIAVLTVIVLIGLALRGHDLSARSFWFDEAFSWRLIQFPLLEMIERTGRDNHPPLYFVLLQCWAAIFGASAAALRALSVVVGGMTIVGMYLVGTAAFPDHARGTHRGQRTGLMMAALVALSAFQVRWAWEARMYALGTCLAAFSSWALLRALHAPMRSIRPWLLYGMLALLFAYTHYYALFTIAAQALFLVGYLLVQAHGRLGKIVRNPVFWHAIAAACILAAGWLPWAPTFLKQRQQVQAGYWSQPVSFWHVPFACYQMLADPQDAAFARAQSLLASGFCGAVLVALLWKARAGEWFVFTLALVPFVLSLLVSLLDTKVFHLKFLLFAHLFLLAGLGVVLGRSPWRPARALICAALFSAMFADSIWFRQKLDIPGKPGARGATEFIVRRRQPEEPIVVCSPLLYHAMLFHAPDSRGYFLYDDGHDIRHDEGAAVLTPDIKIDSLQLGEAAAARVWVVNLDGGSYYGHQAVPVPDAWIPVQCESFPEVYGFQGQIVVVAYQPARAKDDAGIRETGKDG
jgi:hypothetical protein